MPKYGIHSIIISDVAFKLSSSSSNIGKNAYMDLSEYNEIANLGAIGPDLFFWATDYELSKKLYFLYENLNKLIKAYNILTAPIQAIADKAEGYLNTIVENLDVDFVDLIKITVRETEETNKLITSTLGTGLFAGVIGGFNYIENITSLPSVSDLFFNMFTPPLQYNQSVSEWYWFDMLHYRNTGTFCNALVAKAQLPIERAYSYGYLSHIAGDLLGHAYVNQIVGGPYRSHVQRHITVENYMDTWAFHSLYQEDVNETLLQRLNLPKTLPFEIRDLLFNAFTLSFPNAHPMRLNHTNGFLSKDDIDKTYELFYQAVSLMGNLALAKPKEPFSDVLEVLRNALGDLLVAPPSPPPTHHSGLCFSLSCFENFAENIVSYIEYMGELIEYLAERVQALIDLLATALLSLPLSTVLAILYAEQLICYQIILTCHETLALEGYVMPYPASLNSIAGTSLITPVLACTKYPRIKQSENHLICSPHQTELPSTIPDFHNSSADILPNQFINIAPFNLDNLKSYVDAKSPEDTRKFQEEQMINKSKGDAGIGNAVELTHWMILNSKESSLEKYVFANWNLDSDRGYAYKTWIGEIPKDDSNTVKDESWDIEN